MKQNVKLIFVLLLLFLLIIFGLAIETNNDNFNGTAAHTIIGPVTPLIFGSFLIFLKIGFWKTFLLSWLVTGLTYFLLLRFFIQHYLWNWQPEWFFFWIIQSVVLLLIHLLTNPRIPDTNLR